MVKKKLRTAIWIVSPFPEIGEDGFVEMALACGAEKASVLTHARIIDNNWELMVTGSEEALQKLEAEMDYGPKPEYRLNPE